MATPDRPHFCNVLSLVPDGVGRLAHLLAERIQPGHTEVENLPEYEVVEGPQPRLAPEPLADDEAQALADAAMRYAELDFQRYYPGRI